MKLPDWEQVLIGCEGGFNVHASISRRPDLKTVLMKHKNPIF